MSIEVQSLKDTTDSYREPYEVDRRVYPVDSYRHESGVTINNVWVDDESNYSPTREDRQRSIALQDQALADNPTWLTPEKLVDENGVEGQLVPNNPVSDEIYGSSPTMLDWRNRLVPTALALEPMQRPFIDELPNGGQIDDTARSFFIDAIDSIGIRSRARVMSSIVEQHVKDDESNSWISLASGAAIPVFDTLKNVSSSAEVKLALVDIDRNTLDYACMLAEKEGIVHGEQFIDIENNLLRSMVATNRLVGELGEQSANVVDAMGIFEYFKDEASVKFLKNSYQLVKPGGVLIAANMLSNRPELDFNQRGIGWPKIFPRSVDDLVGLIEQADIPLEDVTITIPQDGVYAVMEMRKAG